MITGTALLAAAHIVFTTFGLAGLTTVNVWLALAAKEPSTLSATARIALSVERIAGPILGLGIILGFALAPATGYPLSQPWLLTTYGLILAGIAIQIFVAVPWHLQAARAAQDAAGPAPQLNPRGPVLVAWAFAIELALIALLMAGKPNW